MTATATAAPVKVGDFFVSSWGYDQTNVDFYKVVGMTASGKSVKVQKWTSALAPGAEDGGPSESVVPGGSPATYRDWSAATPEMDHWERQEAVVEREMPVETKRLRVHGDSTGSRASKYAVSFSVNSYSNAYLWDGQPEHQTGYGWGH